MKLKIICNKKEVGTLETSTYPGISHSFELNKKRYKILKVEKTQLVVEEMVPDVIIDESQEVQVKE